MARIRTLKPEAWSDEGLGRCGVAARLLFIGIITQADDAGRFRSAPALLRSAVFPYDDFKASEIDAMLVELEREGLIRRYICHGENFGDLPGWQRHQRVSHPSESSIPPYDPESSRGAPEDSGSFMASSASRDSLPIPSLPKVVGPEKSERARARNEQWDGLEAVFGYSPTGSSEQRHWGKLAKELKEIGATVESIIEAAERYRVAMPAVELTPAALVKHYERLMRGHAARVPGAGLVAQTLELAAQARRREIGGAT